MAPSEEAPSNHFEGFHGMQPNGMESREGSSTCTVLSMFEATNHNVASLRIYLNRLASLARNVPDCLGYDLLYRSDPHQSTANLHHFMCYERWTTRGFYEQMMSRIPFMSNLVPSSQNTIPECEGADSVVFPKIFLWQPVTQPTGQGRMSPVRGQVSARYDPSRPPVPSDSSVPTSSDDDDDDNDSAGSRQPCTPDSGASSTRSTAMSAQEGYFIMCRARRVREGVDPILLLQVMCRSAEMALEHESSCSQYDVHLATHGDSKYACHEIMELAMWNNRQGYDGHLNAPCVQQCQGIHQAFDLIDPLQTTTFWEMSRSGLLDISTSTTTSTS